MILWALYGCRLDIFHLLKGDSMKKAKKMGRFVQDLEWEITSTSKLKVGSEKEEDTNFLVVTCRFKQITIKSIKGRASVARIKMNAFSH